MLVVVQILVVQIPVVPALSLWHDWAASRAYRWHPRPVS
jgi:hypothetical protein